LENIQHNSSLTKRKVLGLLGLIVFSLAFIFACLFSVLPIGRAIVGTFGIATYPLLIILDFYSLAKFLGLNYTKRMKPAVLLTIGIVSVLLVIHAISTFKPLDAVVSGQTFKTYLEISYTSKITLLGSVGSILCGLISLLLGGMGVIIVFVILTTLLFGLFAIYAYEKCPSKWLGFLACILLAGLASLLHTDYGYYGVLLIFLFYVLRNHKIGMVFAFLGLTIVKFIPSFLQTNFYYPNILLCLFTSLAIVPILLYNGKQGKKSKYFFYVFYPCHLLLFAFLRIIFTT